MPINRGIVGGPIEPTAVEHPSLIPARRSAALALPRALLRPFRVLLARREAIQFFVARDIRARYVNSVLGVWWAVIQPLVLLTLYTFIFSRVMNARFGAGGGDSDYALYLFCGLLPWLAFSDGVTRSATVLLEQTPLIKKVVFPSEILPVHVVLSALVVEFIGLLVLLAGTMLFGRPLGWTLIALPIVVALQFLFTAGVAWMLATLTVFVPDVRPAVSLGLTLWMFLTPIVYPATMVPEQFRWLLSLNPMSYVVEAYRAAVLDHQVPAFGQLAVFGIFAAVAFVSGHWVFNRSKQAFADFL
jgi:lipopolysaccharide transport system permease protein